jgi:hypothetical protein
LLVVPLAITLLAITIGIALLILLTAILIATALLGIALLSRLIVLICHCRFLSKRPLGSAERTKRLDHKFLISAHKLGIPTQWNVTDPA